MVKLTDESPMPFGKFKNYAMEDVPASYLIYLWDNNLQHGPLYDYIEENLDVLRKEVKDGAS